MDNWRSFYWRWIKKAFSRNIIVAEVVTGFAALFWQPIAVRIDFPPNWEEFWVTDAPVLFFVIVLSGLILGGLILAPWLMYLEDQRSWEKSKREELARIEQRLAVAEETKQAAIAELNKDVFVYEFGNGASFVYNKRSGGFSINGGAGGGLIQVDGPRLEKLVSEFPRLRQLLSLARTTEAWSHNFTLKSGDN